MLVFRPPHPYLFRLSLPSPCTPGRCVIEYLDAPQIAHRLTGWNALRQRANLLDLTISDDQIKVVTRLVKTLADDGAVTMEEVGGAYVASGFSQSPHVFPPA